ncbi:MAG: energy-coupling factor ABC transporter permease [Candidatus Omnitrophota bacterium]
MHIPAHMLHGQICPVTAAVSALGIASAAIMVIRSKEKPSASRFGAVAAFIFAAQMMNFPIQNGTSGHLLGGVLASALLGVPFGVLATALVLLVQCLVFSDGGVSALGANIFNMALIGAGVGGFLFKQFAGASEKNSVFRLSSLGVAGWLSVILAALACSIELGISGTVPFARVAGAMLSVHALIGMGEGLITVAVYRFLSAESLSTSPKWNVGAPLLAAGIIGTLLSSFASGFPDGLEWVAEKYRFLHEAAPTFVSPLSGYAVPALPDGMLSTGLAGLAGVLLVFALGWLLAKSLTCMKLKTAR